MIEFAIVVLPLALLAFGIAEAGTAWVAHNRVEGAVSTAARVGAAAGSEPDADVRVLAALRLALPEEALENLDRVVIFKPSDVRGSVPAGCIPDVGSPSEVGLDDRCNTYTGATVRAIQVGDDLGTRDDHWQPTSRDDDLAGPEPDFLGVWVRTRHDNISGTFFGDITITRQSIFRLQSDIDG